MCYPEHTHHITENTRIGWGFRTRTTKSYTFLAKSMFYLILTAMSWDGYFHSDIATKDPEVWHFKSLDQDHTSALEKPGPGLGSSSSKSRAPSTLAQMTASNLLVLQKNGNWGLREMAFTHILKAGYLVIYSRIYLRIHSFIPQWLWNQYNYVMTCID